jgi:hypothetical protein
LRNARLCLKDYCRAALQPGEHDGGMSSPDAGSGGSKGFLGGSGISRQTFVGMKSEAAIISARTEDDALF